MFRASSSWRLPRGFSSDVGGSLEAAVAVVVPRSNRATAQAWLVRSATTTGPDIGDRYRNAAADTLMLATIEVPFAIATRPQVTPGRTTTVGRPYESGGPS